MKTTQQDGKEGAEAKTNQRPKGGDLVERLVGRDRPHAERPSAYWAWHARLAADPTCWKFTDREGAIAFAAFIAGWYLRTGEDPDAFLSPNAKSTYDA